MQEVNRLSVTDAHFLECNLPIPKTVIGTRKMQLLVTQWWVDMTTCHDHETQEQWIAKEETKDKYKSLIKQFTEYWSETTKTGKERWQQEKAFDVGRRLSMWLQNQSKFNNSNSNQNGNFNKKTNKLTDDSDVIGNEPEPDPNRPTGIVTWEQLEAYERSRGSM